MDKRKLNKLRLEYLKKQWIIYEKYMLDEEDTETYKHYERKLMLETLAKMGFFE